MLPVTVAVVVAAAVYLSFQHGVFCLLWSYMGVTQMQISYAIETPADLIFKIFYNVSLAWLF